MTFRGLVDSGSTAGFIDSVFVDKYAIPTRPIPPVKLCFLDGSSPSFLTWSVQIPIQFPSSEVVDKDFYVTLLDSSCAIVLGYDFLLQHNPLINWQAGTLNFPPSTPKEFPMHHPTPAPHADTPDRFPSHPVPMLDSAADQGTSPTSLPDLPDSTNPSPPPIDIALINAVAF